MEYFGDLYGKTGKNYFPLTVTTKDWENMEKRIAELEAEVQVLRLRPQFEGEEDFNKRKEINREYVDQLMAGIKRKAFERDIKALFKKHNIGIDEADNYNGDEDYIGTDYYFTISGKTYYDKTIPEIIRSL